MIYSGCKLCDMPYDNDALDRIPLSVPQTKGMPDASCIIEFGWDTSLWLSTTSSSIGGTIFSNQEFEDALRLRFALLPNNLLSKFDVFSANFQIGHALTCKFWGPIHCRHNDISYDLKSLAAIALGNKSKQTEPLINPGSIFVLKSKQ